MLITYLLQILQHLYILVVEDANLAGELRIIKDFFLLGRGELFLAFIDQTQGLLRGPPVNTTEHGNNMMKMNLSQLEK